jgi:1-acyl-sn-glycerol-3-phosphate acyltransferase
MTMALTSEETTEAGNLERTDPTQFTRFYRLIRAIARILFTLLFDLKVYGKHHVPSQGGVLIISNHQSYLDPVLLGVMLDRPMSFLAKSELFTNKHFSWLIRALNAFPIRQRAGDIGALKTLIQKLKDGHMPSMFPEGARTWTGELLPIEPGASLVIRRARVPVVPAIIQGSFEAWPRTKKMFRTHPIAVMYGPRLQTDGLKADEITQLIDRTFREMIAELRRIDGRFA